MLFELSYRDNSGKLAQTNKQTNKRTRAIVTQTGCFRYFFSDVFTHKKKKQKDAERTTFWAWSILV